jgi:hypothetical protein
MFKLITTVTPATLLQVRKSNKCQSQMLHVNFQDQQITVITTRCKVGCLRLYAALIPRIDIYVPIIHYFRN